MGFDLHKRKIQLVILCTSPRCTLEAEKKRGMPSTLAKRGQVLCDLKGLPALFKAPIVVCDKFCCTRPLTDYYL